MTHPFCAPFHFSVILEFLRPRPFFHVFVSLSRARAKYLTYPGFTRMSDRAELSRVSLSSHSPTDDVQPAPTRGHRASSCLFCGRPPNTTTVLGYL
jgi:hypothetical protein